MNAQNKLIVAYIIKLLEFLGNIILIYDEKSFKEKLLLWPQVPFNAKNKNAT